MYSEKEKAILDFLYSANLPATINSTEVEWNYTTPHGVVFGLTNGQAQTIAIIAERCDEGIRSDAQRVYGGHLEYIRGRRFAKWEYFDI